MVSAVDPNDKKLVIVLFFAGIFMIGLISFVVTTHFDIFGPGTSSPAPEDILVQPVTSPPQDVIPPGGTGKVVPTLGSTEILSSTPGSTFASLQNLSPSPVSDLLVTPVPGDSSAPLAPRPFSLSVSPAAASGKPGDIITYTLLIDGGEGQTEPIHFTLKASALFFSEVYDLGDEQPPFPKTSVYQFVVPGNIPPGITIKGFLTATGAGQTMDQPVTLKVL